MKIITKVEWMEVEGREHVLRHMRMPQPAFSTGLVSLTQCAKDLQFKPRAFTKALEEGGYLYRSGGALTPYQRYLDQGLFAMVVGEKGGHGYSQTKATSKGKAYMAQRFASELG